MGFFSHEDTKAAKKEVGNGDNPHVVPVGDEATWIENSFPNWRFAFRLN